MSLRPLRDATLAGCAYGALLYGGAVSLAHLRFNRVGSPRDALALLAFCSLVYGLWCGAFFAVAWLAGRGLKALRRAGSEASPRPYAFVVPGLALFTLVFWEVFFLYGLTYDQAPFGHPRRALGMLGVLAVLALLIAAGVVLAVSLQLRLARALGARRLLGRGALVLAALLVALHAAAPLLPWARSAAAKPAGPARPPVIARTPTGLKVVVVGFDGADWRVLRPMMARGELPVFRRWVGEGVSADLGSIQDSNSAVIWASIYSGMRPERHGALDFYRIVLPGMGQPGVFPVHRTFFKELSDRAAPLGLSHQIPVDRFSLSDPPYWEIADRAGLTIGVADGYFYSFPALRPSRPESWFLTYGLDEFAARASHRTELFAQPRALFREVRPLLAGGDFQWQSLSVLHLLATRPQPELLNFYTHQPDSFQHWYWKWYEPAKFFGVTERERQAKGDLIPGVQRGFDAFLARLEAAVGPDTVIVVASDHGHSPTIVHNFYSQHRHGPPGILILRGGPVRPGVRLTQAGVYDVYPTVLYLLGLPVPDDAAGRVLLDAFDPAFVRAHPVRRIPSYQGLGLSPGLPGARRDGAMNQLEIEKLRSLGYIF
jgi:hypothetical protein